MFLVIFLRRLTLSWTSHSRSKTPSGSFYMCSRKFYMPALARADRAPSPGEPEQARSPLACRLLGAMV
jgi:hypothetical protein